MGQVYAWIVNRLQIRLFAAAVVFWLVGAALDSAWLIQLMGMCAFFALAVIPLRFGLAVVEICILLLEWRRDNSPGPNGPPRFPLAGLLLDRAVSGNRQISHPSTMTLMLRGLNTRPFSLR